LERSSAYLYKEKASVFPRGRRCNGRNSCGRKRHSGPGSGPEAETYLVDPEGRKVMRLPASVASLARVEEPTQEEWRSLWRAVLIQLSQQTAECERLRDRVARLEERAEKAEAERDQSNAIAEDLYGFFRRRVQEDVDRKRTSGRRTAH
jgi:hypothetical protein